MSLTLLALIFVATIGLGIVVCAFFAWLANRMRNWRAAFAIAGVAHVVYLLTAAIALFVVWFAGDAPRNIRDIIAVVAWFAVAIAPIGAFERGFRRRMSMKGRTAWGATFMLLVGSAGIQYGIASVLRLHVIEAFIVPTGAMAPNVIGQHQQARCTQCTFRFYIAPRDMHYMPDSSTMGAPNREPINFNCPNCGLPITVPPLTPVELGDRILTDKTAAPRRWEPIVYREPETNEVNFIHRLVGLPGERITIRDGEVYADGKMLHKPLDTLDDLWFPVHDTAHRPADGSTPTRGWRIATDTGDGPFIAAPIALGGEGNPTTIRFTGPITSAVPYNSPILDRDPGEPVGDVRLQIEFDDYSINKDGSIRIIWQHPRGLIEAKANDDARHEVRIGDRVDRSGAEKGLFDSYVLIVRDGVARFGAVSVVAVELPEPTDSDTSTTNTAEFRIEAINSQIRISRIRIWRDVYYTELGRHTDVKLGPDEFFVLGDNSAMSKDSRILGPIPRANFVGVARWRYWPPARWHTFAAPLAE